MVKSLSRLKQVSNILELYGNVQNIIQEFQTREKSFTKVTRCHRNHFLRWNYNDYYEDRTLMIAYENLIILWQNMHIWGESLYCI